MISQDRPITIAGGGLVGSLLAVMLGKRGHKVTVLEKRSDIRKANLSAGKSINLALANRGSRPLEIAGVFDKVKPMLVPMSGRMIHELDKSPQFSPYGQKPEEVIYSVSRADLNKLLISEAEKTENVRFIFGADIETIDTDNKKITFSGEPSPIDYDILLGTDGAGSKVRKALIESTSGQSVTSYLDHSYKELSIPPSPSGDYQLEDNALHIWPRKDFMVIALPNPDKSFTVTLFMPTRGDISFESLETGNSVKGFFSEYFPDILNLAPSLEDEFAANPTGALGTVRCEPWTFEDSICLLGDAAHAIVPFHGQGMNCGFEDCEVFTELLSKETSWDTLFKTFENKRKINSDAIADLAIENYEIMKASVIDDKFKVKKIIGFELEKNFPESFIPRYSRVMFTHEPYSSAKKLGELQDKILDELHPGFVKTGIIDMRLAKILIDKHLDLKY